MITNHNAELIAQNDAAYLHEKDSKDYVKKNVFQYYTLVNTWTALVKAHNPIAATILEQEILHKGLLVTIARASAVADDLVRDIPLADPSFAMIANGLDLYDALTIFRFPKRFTPVSQALEKATLVAFKTQLNKVTLINRRMRGTGPRFLINAVREELEEMLAGYSCDFTDIKLTNGVSASCDMAKSYKTAYEKIANLRRLAFYDYPYYGTGAVARQTLPNGRTDFDVASLGACARTSCVPKSYKTYRTIAVETVDKQSDQQCVRAALEDALDKSVGVHAPIHNQAINGVLASNLKYATIDMHAASDSLSWWLMHEVLPRRVYEDCMYARSAYLQLPTGERIINPLFCTMGNGFCFALETAVFLACIRAAVKSWCAFQLIPFDDDYCWAYGDDLLVIVDAYEYVVEWLERLDFVINRDKSFTYPSAFRESCGLDWYNGDLVSSVYWPRAVIEPNIDSCASLCALEARLFQRGGGTKYFEAYNFLINQVHRIDKRISVVPINWLLDYQLEGTVLVSLTAPEPECQHYKRAYGLVKGDNLVYEEDRFYVNQIHAKQEMGSIKGGQVIDSYLYYTFLKQGPRYDSDLSSYLGISSSYYDDSLRCKSGGFVVARKRLI